ncbi:hypothetical protein [Metallibacterium scheffleri]|jgi:hypothetical protein|nr:hypothetical protein [Metallibacterium scheffleri]
MLTPMKTDHHAGSRLSHAYKNPQAMANECGFLEMLAAVLVIVDR